MAGTPDHPITITPTQGRVKVTFNGKVVANSTRALTLKEASYPGVQYIPREDVDKSLLSKTAHSTHCPYKGDASYYSICLLYTSPSPRDGLLSRMPSSA